MAPADFLIRPGLDGLVPGAPEYLANPFQRSPFEPSFYRPGSSFNAPGDGAALYVPGSVSKYAGVSLPAGSGRHPVLNNDMLGAKVPEGILNNIRKRPPDIQDDRAGIISGAEVMIGGELPCMDGMSCVEANGEIMAPAGQPVARAKQLRPYQRETIDAVVNRMDKGLHHHLIVLPTGTGKTFTARELLRNLIGSGRIKKKVLVLTHRVEILDQLKAEFANVVGDDKISVVSASRESFDFNGRIVVAAVPTLVKRLDQLDPDDYDAVISDEAHHVPADTWISILHHLRITDEKGRAIEDTDKHHIGMTATPVRSDDRALAVPFTSGGIAHYYSLEDAVTQGYILRPRGLMVLAKGLDLSRASDDRHGDYSKEELEKAVDNPDFHNTVVQAYLDNARGKRVLVFAASVGQARTLTEMFKAGGVRAGFVHGEQDKDERKELIKSHQRGEIDVLINFGVLTEGYDDPGIEVIMMARPTKVLGLYMQMLGRGFRPNPQKPLDDSFLVIDFHGISQEMDAQIDLARVFGLQYEHYNQPDMDPIKIKTKTQEDFVDEDAVEDVGEQEKGSGGRDSLKRTDIGYAEVDIIQNVLDPLPGKLTRILLGKYNGDKLMMAFSLQMADTLLDSYFAGNYPIKESTVRDDFEHADAIGLTVDEVVELWKQSKRRELFEGMMEEVRAYFRKNPRPVGIEDLSRTVSVLMGVFRDKFGNKLGSRIRFINLIAWGRAQGLDVSDVDRLITGADPDFSHEWVERLTSDIDRIMKDAHSRPEDDLQLFAYLKQGGNALADYAPDSASNIKELIIAIDKRLYPVETIEKLVGGLKFMRIKAGMELPKKRPSFEILKRALDEMDYGPNTPARLIALKAKLKELGYDWGREIGTYYTNNMDRDKRTLGHLLADYSEDEAGSEVLRVKDKLESEHMFRLNLAVCTVYNRLTSAVTRMMRTIDWDGELDTVTVMCGNLQKEIDAQLGAIGIRPGRALFSVRILVNSGIKKEFVRHKEESFRSGFSALLAKTDWGSAASVTDLTAAVKALGSSIVESLERYKKVLGDISAEGLSISNFMEKEIEGNFRRYAGFAIEKRGFPKMPPGTENGLPDMVGADRGVVRAWQECFSAIGVKFSMGSAGDIIREKLYSLFSGAARAEPYYFKGKEWGSLARTVNNRLSLDDGGFDRWAVYFDGYFERKELIGADRHEFYRGFKARAGDEVQRLMQTVDWRSAEAIVRMTSSLNGILAEAYEKYAEFERSVGRNVPPLSEVSYIFGPYIVDWLEPFIRKEISAHAFSKGFPEGETQLLKLAGLGEDAANAWQKCFTAFNIIPSICAEMIKKMLYSFFYREICRAVEETNFNITWDELSSAVGGALSLNDGDFDKWVGYFEDNGLSGARHSSGEYFSMDTLLLLVKTVSGERAFHHVERVSDADVSEFPSWVMNVKKMDSILWYMMHRSMKAAELWHIDNPFGNLEEFKIFLRNKVLPSDMSGLAAYFGMRTKEIQYQKGMSSWLKEVQEPIDVLCARFKRLMDWHTGGEAMIKMLEGLYEEVRATSGLGRLLEGESAEMAIGRQVAAYLQLTGPSVVRRRLEELRSKGLDVTDLIGKFSATDPVAAKADQNGGQTRPAAETEQKAPDNRAKKENAVKLSGLIDDTWYDTYNRITETGEIPDDASEGLNAAFGNLSNVAAAGGSAEKLGQLMNVIENKLVKHRGLTEEMRLAIRGALNKIREALGKI